MKLLESSMSEPVSDWLRQKGLTPYAEVAPPYWVHGIDLIGWDGDKRIVAVEMKRSLTKDLVYQGNRCRSVTDEVYVAVMSEPRKSGIERCRSLGIGVLKVEGGLVIELSPLLVKDPGYRMPQWRRDKLFERLRRSIPGGVGGMPTTKGIGPARAVRERILAYRREHPGATWKELYENVPHHYASMVSMRGAQHTLEETIEAEERKEKKRKGVKSSSQDS